VPKVLMILTATAAALLAAPLATAAPPPAPATATLEQVVAPHPISILQVPDVRKSGGVETGTKPGRGGSPGGGVSTADCGACIVYCWGATWRAGFSDLSGHAYLYQHDYWCGNGAVVTYAQASQTYDQSGWFTILSVHGPWWSGGCIGCSYIMASGYMTWAESIPYLFTSTGTTWLNVGMYAYGGSQGSGASAT
jgi:hypothetical protein